MGRMSSDNEIQALRRANRDLDHFLARFSRAAVLGTDEEVTALLQVQRTLTSIGGLLKQDIQQSDDDDVQNELAIYRANLIKLRRELADLQDSAAACKARLFARQEKLAAAQAWCAASRDTR
jgi:hypothetical protein